MFADHTDRTLTVAYYKIMQSSSAGYYKQAVLQWPEPGVQKAPQTDS